MAFFGTMTRRLTMVLLGLAAGFAQPAAAALVGTGATQIVFLENGWYGEGFAIHITPGTGVTGCAAPKEQLGVDKGHPSYKEIVAMAIAAYSTGAKVEFIVDQGVCVLGSRTKIVSIRLLK
jgi:hypothetical protein